MYLLFVCGVATSARLLDWVGNAISIDEREPVTEQVLYSAAVVDVFSSIDSVFLFSIFGCLYTRNSCIFKFVL